MKGNLNIKMNFDGLEKLKKAFSRKYEVRVGIFGSEAKRDDGGFINNPELGVVQEFGSKSKNIPARSFLRMPLELKMKDLVKWLQRQNWEEAIIEDDIESILEKLGLKAENVIDDAFDTKGFGQWASNKPATIKRKGSDAPLIDLGELRRSITSRVVKR